MQDPRAQQRNKDDEARLRKIAEGLSLVQSDQGRKVIALIKARLEARMIDLAKEDAQCKALVEVLTEMGHQYSAAKAATKELTARYITDADES